MCRNIRPLSWAIAVAEIVVAIFVMVGIGRLPPMLKLYGACEEMIALLVIAAGLIVIGLLIPNRKIRHVGLWFSSVVMFGAFGLLLEHGMAGIAALTLPGIAVLSLATYVIDTRGKPRHVQKVDS